MKRKSTLFLIITLNITLQSLFLTSSRCCTFTTKEKEILEKHKISDNEKKVLDEIFNNLDQEVLDLFDGKNRLNSAQ